MKFGLTLPHFRQVASPEAIVEFARRAEELGYDSLWATDHVVVPETAVVRFGEVFYEPLIVLGYVIPVTRRITLGTSALILPYRNPVVTAKMLATIDVLSGGRTIFAVAAGWAEDEFNALGVPFHERGRLSDEYIRIFKVLWTQDVPEFEGRYFKIRNVRFEPKPIQKPHPPLWVGGNSEKGIRRAVRFGDGWHPTRPQIPDLKQSLAVLTQYCQRYGRDPKSLVISAREPLKILDRREEGYRRIPLIGTPDDIVNDLRQFKELGVQHFVLDTFYSVPELDRETLADALRTIERFAREIRPAVVD